MIKTSLVLIHLIGVLCLNLWFVNGIEITHNFPEQIDQGEERIISVDVNKGIITGFAKLQLEFESGLDVEAYDLNGASFTYKNGIAKCIWLALPIQESVRIKLRLKASPEAQDGLRTIVGKFSYLQDNRRMTHEFEPHEIIVGKEVPDADIPALIIEEIDNPEVSTGSPVNIHREITYDNDSEVLVSVAIIKKNVEGYVKLEDVIPGGFEAIAKEKAGANFQVVRNKVKFSWFNLANDQTVEVSYILIPEDPTTSGFYDIVGEFSYLKEKEAQFLPLPTAQFKIDNLVVEELDRKEVLDKDIPEEPIAEISQEINVPESHDNPEIPVNKNPLIKVVSEVDIDVEGEPPTEPLTNILPPESTKVDITTIRDVDMAMETIEPPIATLDPRESSTEQVPVKEITKNEIEELVKDQVHELPDEMASETISAPVKPKIDEPSTPIHSSAIKKDNSTSSLSNLSNISNAPQPEEGISYRVQIAAGNNVVDAAHFNKKFKFTAPFIMENHEGWVKYTTGKFDIYKKARDKRENIRSSYQFDGPFVTAYNYGERITVQEALMITSQKWYQ